MMDEAKTKYEATKMSVYITHLGKQEWRNQDSESSSPASFLGQRWLPGVSQKSAYSFQELMKGHFVYVLGTVFH